MLHLYRIFYVCLNFKSVMYSDIISLYENVVLEIVLNDHLSGDANYILSDIQDKVSQQ